jgi:quercetin dioxygenase-like cupin family protein
MLKHFLVAAAFAALAALPAAADETPRSKVTVVFDQALPNVPGKSMRVVLVEYPPGGASAAHTHPGSAFIYATVLEGSVTSQVNDGPVTAYAAGQSFIEMPGDHHAVSRNTSATEPARLLAVFVVDTADRKLVTEDAH